MGVPDEQAMLLRLATPKGDLYPCIRSLFLKPALGRVFRFVRPKTVQLEYVAFISGLNPHPWC